MRTRIWWIVGLIVVLGAAVAWYLGSPLFINRTVQEPFPASAGATIPAGMTREQVETEMMKASKEVRALVEAMPAAAATTLARGTFTDADTFHKGSGTALLLQVGSDRLVRLEEFKVTNGPDLYVYLAAHPQPRSRADVEQAHVSLGKLKGNIGAQNYPIPSGVDVGRFRSVVIYCQPFHVVFSTATLQAAQ